MYRRSQRHRKTTTLTTLANACWILPGVCTNVAKAEGLGNGSIELLNDLETRAFTLTAVILGRGFGGFAPRGEGNALSVFACVNGENRGDRYFHAVRIAAEACGKPQPLIVEGKTVYRAWMDIQHHAAVFV